MTESPVYKIATDGTRTDLPDRHPTLEELQEAVGYIQMIYLSSDTLMLIDEEGHMKKDTKLNPAASKIANQPIVGDVVILPSSYFE